MATNQTTTEAARMFQITQIARTAAVLVGALALGAAPGCGGGGDETVTYQTLQPIISTSCSLSSSCHASGTSAGGQLQLAGSDGYCNLVGPTKGATFLTTARATYPRRVVPGDSAKSFLYKKLMLTTTDPNLGTGMPQGQPLSAADIDKFRRWIDQGAKDASGVAGPGTCN